MVLATAGAGLHALLAAIGVVGVGRCPRPERVEEALPGFLSPQQLAAEHWALLTVEGGTLGLFFFDRTGRRLGERRLRAAGDCRELVLAAAAAVAAFELDFGAVAPFPAVAAGPAPAGAWSPPRDANERVPAPAAAGDAPAPIDLPRSPIAAPIGPARQPDPLASLHAREPVAPTPATAAPLRWELGVGLGVSLADALGPSLSLLAAATSKTSPWMAEIGLSLEGERGAPLPVGSGAWSRQTALLAAGVQLGLGLAQVSASACAWPGLLITRGSGLNDPRTVVNPALGFGPSLRLSWPLVGWQPWLATEAEAWLGEQRIAVNQTAGGYRLPPYAARLALGVSWILP